MTNFESIGIINATRGKHRNEALQSPFVHPFPEQKTRYGGSEGLLSATSLVQASTILDRFRNAFRSSNKARMKIINLRESQYDHGVCFVTFEKVVREGGAKARRHNIWTEPQREALPWSTLPFRDKLVADQSCIVTALSQHKLQ